MLESVARPEEWGRAVELANVADTGSIQIARSGEGFDSGAGALVHALMDFALDCSKAAAYVQECLYFHLRFCPVSRTSVCQSKGRLRSGQGGLG